MRVLFRDITLIDGVSDEPLVHVDVLVEGDRIATITGVAAVTDGRARPGSPVVPITPDRPVVPVPLPSLPVPPMPAPDRVVDGAGVTLLPGLIDCHVHYTVDPDAADGFVAAATGPRARTALMAASLARRALASGVTTARSAGAAGALDVVLRDAIAAGLVPGPRLLAAGPAVTITGGHGRWFGREVDGEVEMVRAVRRNIRDGSDVIKVVASEAAMLTTARAGVQEIGPRELRAIVGEAGRLGVRVLSHAQGADSVVASAEAGVASVEHAFLADEPALEALARSGATLVPTLVVTDAWRTLPGLDDAQRRRQAEIEVAHRRSCEIAIGLGIPLATGTDCGVPGVSPDVLWREIRLLHEHGLPAMDALRAATSVAARLLGLEGMVGHVAPGMSADLVLVDGDPLSDLGVLRRPRLVMQAGRIVSERTGSDGPARSHDGGPGTARMPD